MNQLTHATTAINPVGTPTAPSVTYTGTPNIPSNPPGALSATYKIVAFNRGGSSLASLGGSFSTLAPTNDTYQATLTWLTVPAALYYAVYRVTASGVNAPISTGIIGFTDNDSFIDTGQAGDGTVAPAVTRIAPGQSWNVYIFV